MFSTNSEAFSSELVENLKKMFLVVGYMAVQTFQNNHTFSNDLSFDKYPIITMTVLYNMNKQSPYVNKEHS